VAVEDVEAGYDEAGGGAEEDFGGEMRASGEAGETDERGCAVGYPGQPLVLFVALGEDGGNAEAHHGVAGGETAGFAERAGVTIEKGVVIRAVDRSVAGTIAAGNGFENDHENGVIDNGFAGEERSGLVVVVVAQQTDQVERSRHSGDYAAAYFTAESAAGILEGVELAEMWLGLRIGGDESGGGNEDGEKRQQVIALRDF